MPENRNDDAGQSGGEPNGFAGPASGQQQYGQAPQQPPYGQQPYGQQPPYGQQAPYGQLPPYGQQAPYGSPNYGYPGAYQAPAKKPGKALGIGGLILSCMFFIPYASVVGLILSIVGLAQSRKANERNGPALAGIIIGAVVLAITVIVTILIFVFAAGAVVNVVEVCAEYGTGTHTIDGMTYTCNVNSTGFEQSL